MTPLYEIVLDFVNYIGIKLMILPNIDGNVLAFNEIGELVGQKICGSKYYKLRLTNKIFYVLDLGCNSPRFVYAIYVPLSYYESKNGDEITIWKHSYAKVCNGTLRKDKSAEEGAYHGLRMMENKNPSLCEAIRAEISLIP